MPNFKAWRLAWVAMCLLVLQAAGSAQANVSTTTNFTPADPARTGMDVGGVWNGTLEVTAITGDSFSISLRNLAGGDPVTDTAYELTGSLTLPVGFQYVPGTASGIAGISANQAGTTLNLSIPAGTDLAPGASVTIDLGLAAGTGVAGGTYDVDFTFGYGSVPGGAGQVIGPVSKSVVVEPGASSIVLTPTAQSVAIAGTAAWDVIVRNTGFGGLFDVVIDESLVDPNPAGSLQLTGMTQLAPVAPAATGSAPILTLPYLAPGETFTVRVTATVTGCDQIDNQASSTDRTGATADHSSAQVQLDLNQPLIAYTPPAAALLYSGPVPVAFTVQNTGLGNAVDVSLSTNLPALGVDVTNVASGWSYAAGTFTLTANGGDLANMGSIGLSFELAPTDVCANPGGGTVIWNSSYQNDCGDTYATPTEVSSTTGATDAPEVFLSKSADPERVEVGSPLTFSISLSAINPANIGTDPLVITDQLPAGISGVSLGVAPAGTSVACSGACGPGDTITWTVPLAALTRTLNLSYDATAPADPCEGGNLLTNTAVLTATSTEGCDLSQSASASTLLINNPGGTSTQNFNHAGAPDGRYETGAADDGDGVQEVGEGEFIPLTADYGFDAMYPGTWAGTTFDDDFASLAGQVLVSGSLEISVDGGAFAPIPAGSVSGGTGSLSIDLAFVAGAGFANDPNVAGHGISIVYETTISDADLGGSASGSSLQRSTLTLGGPGGGANSCPGAMDTFVQGVFIEYARARGDISVSIPSQIEICEVFTATITVSNGTVELPSNLLITALTSGDYDFVVGQTPVYGGFFNSGNITFTENGGSDPTFELTPNTTELGSSGTIAVQMRRRAGRGVTPSPVSATLDYDDNETSIAGLRAFQDTGSDSPILIREAQLALTTSPQALTILGQTAQWRIYITNTGDGTAYGATAVDTLPAGLTPDTVATDAANPGLPVSAMGQVMTWALGDLAPGQTVAIDVVASLDASNCSFAPDANSITAQWGCEMVFHQTQASSDPAFILPDGALLALHDSSASTASLCGTGSLMVKLRNTGTISVYDAVLTESLNPLATGIDIVLNTVEYSTNDGGSWNPGGNPTGAGAPYTFTKAQIPAFAELETALSGGVDEVWVRFSISASELANSSTVPVSGALSGNSACGDPISAPASDLNLTVERPDIEVTATGRNLVGGSFADIIGGEPGDQIEWRVQIANSGGVDATNVRIELNLPATGNTAGSLNGPGHGGTAFTSGDVVSLPDIAAGTTATYLITETLGVNCVDDDFDATATWGCVDNGASAASNLFSPSTNAGSATIEQIPDFSGSGISITHTPLDSGYTEIELLLTNGGGTVQNLVLTEALPPAVTLDTTFAPTLVSSGGITGMSQGGTASTPVFTLAGDLRFGETATVTLRAVQASDFDTTFDPTVNPETSGNGLDPTLPPTGNNQVTLDFESTCGVADQDTASLSLDPLTPDVDIAVSPAARPVRAGNNYTYTFTVTNKGDTGSVAGSLLFAINAQAGFSVVSTTITSAGNGGGGGACAAGNCTAVQLGTLAAGASATIDVVVTALDNGGALAVTGEVRGQLLDAGGNDYSLDQAVGEGIGFELDKTFVSTSESFTSDPDLAVGEEITWNLRGYWFGSSAITNVTLRDSLPAGYGYVTHSFTGNHTLGAVAVSGNSQVQSGAIDFGTFGLPGGSGTFEVRLTARVLNIGTAAGVDLTNHFGGQFTALGSTFASSDPADGFGGSESELHGEHTFTVRKPEPAMAKLVRNLTSGGAFATSVVADAGDLLEYQVTVSNSGDIPVFDLAVDDTLGSAKLLMVDGANDGIDNDGDGLIDLADPGGEGSYTAGASGSVSFTEANTGLASGASLGRLDDSASVTLTYRATVGSSVFPGETLSNAVAYVGSSLPGATGNQSAPTGTTGDADGEEGFSGNTSADAVGGSLSMVKTMVTTSQGGDASTDLRIGEQVRFRLTLEVPEGTIPNFEVEDLLPEGFALVSTPAVSLGAAVGGGQPTITPGALPAFGSPLTVTWDFGTRLISSGDAAQRTISIEYDAQVRNIAANVDGLLLQNTASFDFDNAPANGVSVDATIQTTALTIAKTVTPAGPVDAGDRLTYRLVVTNTGDRTAFDLDLEDVLPPHVSYVANSTTLVQGAVLGEPDDSSGTLTWGRGQAVAQDLDLTASGVLEFTYQVDVDDAVEPDEVLSNAARVDWTSLDGDPGPSNGTAVGTAGSALGERTGTGGSPNLSTRSDSVDVDVSNTFDIAKVASGDTVSGDGFRIGDLITYTLTIDVQEGTVDGLSIADTLPGGLEFFDFTAIAPASGASGFTYTAPTGPNAPSSGDSGAIAWTLGTLVNAGDTDATNDTLTLVYRARVIDAGGLGSTPTTQQVTNGAQLAYEDEAANAEATGVSAVDSDVLQPALTIDKALASGQATTVGSGGTVSYVVTVTNGGDAPAYNTVLRDVIPDGMRAVQPATTSVQINGLAAAVTPTWNGVSGDLTWSLADAQAIDPGQTLVIAYSATIDSGTGGGVDLDNAAGIDSFGSKPSADSTERRSYGPVAAASAGVATPAPTDMTKVVSAATANIGETLTYTLTVPGTTVGSVIYDATITDALQSGLRITGVTHNGAALGATVTDNSTANLLDLEFDAIPPGQQAVISVQAVVENLVGTNAGTGLSNDAEYTWAKSDGAPAEPAISAPTVTSTVTEPVLSIDKTFKSQVLGDVAQGLQAGDTVTYTVTITNGGDGPAHDLVLRDLADDELITPVVSAGPDDPGATSNGGSVAGVTTWSWDIAGPIAPGANYSFDITFTLDAAVQPYQSLTNSTEVDWTSTAGANADERDASGAQNDYTSSDPTPVQVTAGSVSLDKSELTGGDGSYTVGEEVTYTLLFRSLLGQTRMVHIVDSLPAGLVYTSSSFVVNNLQRIGGGPVTLLSGPTAGASGPVDLDFSFGDMESTGPDPTIELTLTARIEDIPANVDGFGITNVAKVQVENPPGSGTLVDVPAISDVIIAVVEPALTLAVDGPTNIDLGTPADFVARIENAGDSDGWQPEFQIQLPAEARATDPSTLSLGLAISGGRTLALAAGSDYTTAYAPGTGVLTVSLIGTNGFIAPGELLTVSFQAELDPSGPDALNLAVLGTVTDYASLDQTGGALPDTRTYPLALGAGTTGTASGISGDDETDDHTLDTRAPVLTLLKAVNLLAAQPGDTLHYQLTLSNTGSIDAIDVDLTDNLSTSFASGSLANLVIAPATGTPSAAPNGGVNGTGLVTVAGMTVGAGASVTIDFDADLATSLPSGLAISNQAAAALPVYSDPVLSDSANPADDDGVETGNDAGDPDDDDPTTTTLGSMPVITATKDDRDLNGGALQPGDLLRYTIVIANTGNEKSIDTIATDAIPANTTYEPGSTTLNGNPVADIGGAPEFQSGLLINSPGLPAGELEVGQPATLVFDVVVAGTASDGTVISNQVTIDGAGEGSGPFGTAVSNDPDTSGPADPTTSVVGTGALLDVAKLAVDDNGSDLQPTDSITYTLHVRNLGNQDLSGTLLTDVIPSDLTYTPASLSYDDDGPGPNPARVLSDAADGDEGDFGLSLAGAISLAIGDLPGGSEVTLSFQATVNGGLAAGTPIANQALVSSTELPDEASDSDANDANGDQPTVLVVGAAPYLLATKSVADLNGGALVPGDTLEYTIALTNAGSAPALNAVLTDPVPPAGTTYVAGSSMLGGVPLADGAGPTSPLIGGVAVGTVDPGETAVVRYRVDVGAVAPGTAIDNQASFVADGGLAGVSDSGLDDGVETGNDPLDPNDDDPTRITVGGSAGTASVTGQVWLDTDHDRSFGPAELAQPGWTAEILQRGTVIASSITDATGTYQFSGLPPGSGYQIRFRHPVSGTVFGGAVSSEPGVSTATGAITNLTLPAGQLVLDQSLPLDPSGVVYDSLTRLPVPGATMTITGPAGFDPATQVLPGQQSQVTGADGYYRFDLLPSAPAGVYSLVVSVPTGYSTVLPAQIVPPPAGVLDPTGLPDPLLVVPNNGAPTGVDPTTYHFDFDLAIGDPNVINNHIPIDPLVENSLTVRKTTPKTSVVRGDLIPYRITVTNNVPYNWPSVRIEDFFPAGFQYVSGSASVDGVATEPTIAGRQLTWPPFPMAVGQVRTIDLVLVVGAGVGDGEYGNIAFGYDGTNGDPLSNVARVLVSVVPDGLFDCADLIGQVYVDANGNGYQDEGEPGLPGVRIATARGLLVTTDQYGRYHITCADVPDPARGSNFIVKVDPHTLPSGFRLTTENPRVVRLTRGRVTKANFGVRASGVVQLDLDTGAFEVDSAEPGAALTRGLDQLVERLERQRSVLRVTYSRRADEAEDFAAERLRGVIERIRRTYGGEPLSIESQIHLAESVRSEPDTLPEQPVNHPADTRVDRDVPPAGRTLDTGRVSQVAPPVNTEGAAPTGSRDSVGPAGWRVKTDHEYTLGSIGGSDDAERANDLALDRLGIRVQFDGFNEDKVLNVTAAPDSALRDEAVTFSVYTNYARYFERAEVLIFGAGDSLLRAPLARIPVNPLGLARWAAGSEAPDQLQYLVEVADAEGRRDRTLARPLTLLDRARPVGDEEELERELATGYGENHLGTSNIPVRGGAITVSSQGLPENVMVSVFGKAVRKDPEGRFVVREILPPGSHDVAIGLSDTKGQSALLTRTVHVPTEDWFYVALADLTVGNYSGSGPVEGVTGDEQYDEEVYARGRLAFYLKGKVKGEWLLTASLDTREDALEDILSNLDEKDPRQLLRRLDPDRFYPVYGDDSTLVQDAPTQGKLYVRIERGATHAMWGNFITKWTGTDLAQVDRALYGAKLHWESEDSNEQGAARTRVEVFAAEPETVAAREELRGTGGSLYYLRNRDITLGSERLRVETRDKVSGLVVATQDLIPQQDYDIDYIQGRVLLAQPLASTAADGLGVNNGSPAGNPVYLVARYEYRPGFDSLSDVALGGRVQHDLNDRVKVGLTASHQEQTGTDQTLLGADLTVKAGSHSYVKAEVAGTDGTGAGQNISLDGGFAFGQDPQQPLQDEDAVGLRVEAGIDNRDLGLTTKGRTEVYWQHLDEGFSAPGQLARHETDLWGISLTTEVAEGTQLIGRYDEKTTRGGGDARGGEIDVRKQFDERWSGVVGIRNDEVEGNGPTVSGREGSRTDLALRAEYDSQRDYKLSAFVQGTLERSGDRDPNNRAGLGAEVQVNDRLEIGGELSGGNGGLGALVSTEFRKSDRTNQYLNYRLDADRTDNGIAGRNGTLTTGVRSRFTDELSTYGEERFVHGDRQSGIVHAYGLDYAPSDAWTLGLALENGELGNSGADPLERTAASVSAGFRQDAVTYGGALEYRQDEQAGNERSTWLVRNDLGYQIDQDWRLALKFDLSRSDDEQGTFFEGDFTEGSLGFAYRPTQNDRWNVLARYTYLEDVPSPGQVNRAGGALDYAQRSHVAAVDVNYDATPWLTVGGKYAVRMSELKATKASGPWFESQAQLVTLRGDVHFVKDWDALLEGRVLDVSEAEDRRSGFLAVIYRHLGENAKIGIGYNFTDFSDDLTQLDYDFAGFFVNLVGKF